MSSPRSLGQFGLPTIPAGDVVASYPTYEAARGAVDVLVRQEGLPVSSISVVGSDLKSVERITGRMNYGRAALSGLMNGVMIGLFMSLVWIIFFPEANFLSIVGVFVMSLAFGVIWGILTYALSPQKREFTSIMQVTASRFDIVVPHNMSAKVRETLQRGGSWSSPQATPGGAAPGQGGQPGQGTPPWQGGQPGAGGQPQQGSPSGWGAAQSPASGPVAQAEAGAGEPSQPAQPPRTYGEMQDELLRQERERRQRAQQGAQQQGEQSQPPAGAASDGDR